MNKMKKIMNSKLFWMIISFLLSLSVWVYITTQETSEVTRTFRGVQVELTGKEDLESNNKLVTDVSANTVTVEISGPRRVVNALDSSMITAQIDVSKTATTGESDRYYELVFPSGTEVRSLNIVSRSPEIVTVTFDEREHKEIPVTGYFAATIPNDASVYVDHNNITYEPSTITVYGPSKALKAIDRAYVVFGTGKTATSTISEEQPFTLLDANGNECSTAGLTYTPERVIATAPVKDMRDVPLEIGKKSAPPSENNYDIHIDPGSVLLVGDSSLFPNQIVLGTIDFSTFAESCTVTYPIRIDNRLENILGYSEATVTVTILGLTTKRFEVTENQFRWTGLDENTDVEILSASIPILLRGSERDLSLIGLSNIRCSADLSEYRNYKGSTVQIPFKVDIIGFNNVIRITDETLPEYTYTVVIRLVDKGEEAEAEG
jgi:YbbR domain-containing protein